MSQQLDRTGVRPPDSPALLSYTGQVMLIGDPEIGKTGKERPRKVVISDRPGQYQGKTFRCWSWKPDFEMFKVGAWVTVKYEVEPNPDPTRHGSNMISVAEAAQSGGGGAGTDNEGSHSSTTSFGNAVDSGWGSPSPAPAPSPAGNPPPAWQEVKQQIASKDDYWEQKAAKDDLRSLEMEAAWGLKCVLDLEGPDHDLSDETLVADAIRIILLKRRVAVEMGR